jgi:two-component system sensor histidine kinase FlrB
MSAEIRHECTPAVLPAALARLLGIANASSGDRTESRRNAGSALPRAEADRLREAFTAFTRASERLEHAYAGLQGRVESLTVELAWTRRELEQQLAEKAAVAKRQSALLAALPAGVIVLDARGVVTASNPAGERLLDANLQGCRREEVLARLVPGAAEGDWLTKTATPLRVSIKERVLEDGSGSILLLTDVTEACEAREQLARNERLAAMGEMAARVAHQLRSPLATAVLYASQLARAELGVAERARFADKTLARLRHLERMTREVLRYARGDAAESTDVGVDSLVDEATQVMAPLMAGRGVLFSATDLTGGAVVRGDRPSLVCALTSLLENALQATPQGGKVRITAMANRNKVRICVSDTGCGIPEAGLARVFEPFYTTRADGTGLGLAIVRSTVQSCGGAVEVASSPGNGSSFTLDLPRAAGALRTAFGAGAGRRLPQLVAASAAQGEQEAA